MSADWIWLQGSEPEVSVKIGFSSNSIFHLVLRNRDSPSI